MFTGLIERLLNYAPFIWMFCQRTLYFKMEKIYHKTLEIIHRSNASFQGLRNKWGCQFYDKRIIF